MERRNTREVFFEPNPQPGELPARSLITPDIGQAAFAIINQIAPLFALENIYDDQIEKRVVEICKTLTGATWAELILIEEDNLRVLGPRQSFSWLKIDDQSLPGFVTITKEQQFISNPGSSTFYNRFPVKLAVFTETATQPVEPFNVACIPICDTQDEVKAVICLFNKFDEQKAQAYFGEADAYLIHSVGLLLIQLLQAKERYQELQQLNDQITASSSVHEMFTQVSNNILRTKHLVKKCIEILEMEMTVGKEVFKLVSEIMMSDAMIIHVYQDDTLMPCMSLGIKYDDASELVTRTAEYAAFTHKRIFNVRELMSEPLMEHSSILKFQSLLGCPIISKEGQVIGVIELFRNSTAYNSLDEKIMRSLLRTLCKIPQENYQNLFTLPATPRPSRLSMLPSPIDAQIASLKLFHLRQDDMYDYLALIGEATSSALKLVQCDQSNIYIVDQQSKMLWTRKSEFCEVLTIPLVPESVLGFTCERGKPLILPSNEGQLIDEAQYQGEHVLSYPVKTQQLPDKVIAVLIISRANAPFTLYEIDSIKNLSKTIAHCLENLFSTSMIPTATIQDVSPIVQNTDAQFRAVNLMKQNSKRQVKVVGLSQAPAPLLQRPERGLPLAVQNICNLTRFQNAKMFDLKAFLNEIKSQPRNALKIMSDRLSRLIPCDKARLLMYDEKYDNLIDPATQSTFLISGLIKRCVESMSIVHVQAQVWRDAGFDKHSDSIGCERPIENFLAVPVIQHGEIVCGALVFVNATLSFTDDDVGFAQFLSLIPREIASFRDKNMLSIENLLKEGRRYKMLEYWYKQMFIVANASHHKDMLARDILYKLSTNSDLETLLQSTLLILKEITNSESCSIIYPEVNTVMSFGEGGKVCKRFEQWEDRCFQQALVEKRPVSGIDEDVDAHVDNFIMFPYINPAGDGTYCVVVAVNKRDEVNSFACNYTKEDENWLKEFAKAIYGALFPRDNVQAFIKLRQVIKKQAQGLNSYGLIKTIRNAAQTLLECDRATVFIREGNELVVRAQGLQQEIPIDFRIPIGKGIVGNVVQTGQLENITDVYNDDRFNTEMDKKTGYRTRSMLCVPVINSENEVIAALQMINKKNSSFDRTDEQTLEIFSELVATVLQNWGMMQKIIEERTSFLKIFDSIGNNILTFDREGNLHYYNKPFYNVFGISENLALTSKYNSWLRHNKKLVLDIASVYQNPYQKIHRNRATIFKAPLRRTTTLASLKAMSTTNMEQGTYTYTVAPLHEFGSDQSAGIVLILEDVTEFAEISKKFNEMQSQIQKLTNPVKYESKLQKCLDRLSNIMRNVEDPSIDIYSELYEISSMLRSGNLYSASVLLPNAIDIDNELTAFLDMHGNTAIQGSEIMRMESPMLTPLGRQESRNPALLDIPLSELRTWDLNAFEVENHTSYIKAMLQDFDLLEAFHVSENKLTNFVAAMRKHYSIYDNPFHNFFHGFSVMHATYMVLANTPAKLLYEPHEIFALLIASLGHDVEHTGRTNIFEMNRESNLAIIYNDRSVLENHHAAMTFRLLQNEENDILSRVEHDVKKQMRKMIVIAILGTDMSKHFPIIADMNTRFAEKDQVPVGVRENDKEKIAELIVHSADLAHPTKELSVYSMWSQRVCQEFTNQYKEEQMMELPLSVFMKDLDQPKVYFKNEVNFLKVVVKPLWTCMNNWLEPTIDYAIENLEDNIASFQKRFDDLEA